MYEDGKDGILVAPACGERGCNAKKPYPLLKFALEESIGTHFDLHRNHPDRAWSGVASVFFCATAEAAEATAEKTRREAEAHAHARHAQGSGAGG
jgi:hypothetical protein